MTDQPPPKQHVVVHAARWRYVFWTLLIGGILAFEFGWLLLSHRFPH